MILHCVLMCGIVLFCNVIVSRSHSGVTSLTKKVPFTLSASTASASPMKSLVFNTRQPPDVTVCRTECEPLQHCLPSSNALVSQGWTLIAQVLRVVCTNQNRLHQLCAVYKMCSVYVCTGGVQQRPTVPVQWDGQSAGSHGGHQCSWLLLCCCCHTIPLLVH